MATPKLPGDMSPFQMFFRKITGTNLTNNDKGSATAREAGLASTPTRNMSLNPLAGGQTADAIYGSDTDYDFSVDSDVLPEIEGAVTQFNSLLDLRRDLPSVTNTQRFTKT